MHEMVQRYSSNLHPHSPTQGIQPKGVCVLLTGSTGGFGCHLLTKLVEDKDIRQIVAVNRVSQGSEPLRVRQERLLVEQGLSPTILDTDKVLLLEADLTTDGFGLDEETYEKVVTCFRHT